MSRSKLAIRVYRKGGKRALDLVLGSVSLALAAPAMLVIAIAVRVRLGAPVLFRQERAGLDGKPFVLCKFRTMREGRDETSELLADEVRLTRLGRFLRRTSLDELPELFNVLKGDMSLVGPRPLLVEYLKHYGAGQARRHEAKPGLTGWAQVNGRNALSWEEKFALDTWYVDHVGLTLDLRILWRTLGQVLSGRGVQHEGCATMPRFEGSSEARSPRS